MAEVEPPELSVVVVIVSDTTSRPDTRHLEPCLTALMQQTGAPPMEIIVPYLPGIAGIAGLRDQYSGVRFVEAADLGVYRRAEAASITMSCARGGWHQPAAASSHSRKITEFPRRIGVRVSTPIFATPVASQPRPWAGLSKTESIAR